MSATAFYIPSSSSSSSNADITALQTQIAALKADVDPMKADLNKATSTSAGAVGGTLVRRDANKDFEGSKLKLWHLESAATALSIAGDNQTQTLSIGSGTGMQTINMGNNGVGATVINIGGSGDTVNVGTSASRAGAVTLFPASLNLNSSVTDNVATLTDLNLGMVYNGGNPASNFFSPSGRIMMNATAHNTVQGRKNIPAGFQVRVLANGTSPSKSVLAFLGSETVFGSTISECGSIDSDGTFKCSSVESRGTTLNIAGQDNTSVLNLGSGTGMQTINMGNTGAGTTTINIGGGTDLVNFAGAEHKFTGAVQATGVGAGTIRARSLIQIDAWILPLGQGAGIGWNRLGGNGYTTFVNQQGGGTGGWEWLNYKNDNTPTADPQMVLTSGGNLSVTGTVRSSGITLPNAGGTPYGSILNHYEEYDWVFQWKYGANLSTSVTVKVVKIGKVVTCTMSNLPVWNAYGSEEFFEPSVMLPERFRPVGPSYSRSPICVESGGVGAVGMMTHSAGLPYVSRVYASASGDLFASAGSNMIYPFHVTWVAA